MILLLVALQGTSPTVGDTIWLTRRVTAPPGAEVRPTPWTPNGEVELLGRPIVIRSNSDAEIRYPAVAWAAGPHDVSVPGPVIVAADGHTDSLPPQTFHLEVASVLPPNTPDSSISIQPEAGPLLQPVESPGPVIVALVVALVAVVLLARWWRRPGPPLPGIAPPGAPTAPPVDQWVASGEGRAVAAAAVEFLRRSIAHALPEAHTGLDLERCLAVIAQLRPAWPQEEISNLLRALDMARFAPLATAEPGELYTRAMDLGARLPARPS
jgi:hypothetical protein